MGKPVIRFSEFHSTQLDKCSVPGCRDMHAVPVGVLEEIATAYSVLSQVRLFRFKSSKRFH